MAQIRDRLSEVIEARRQSGEQQQMAEQQQIRPIYDPYCFGQNMSTVGLTNNHRQIELDITPLNKFVKNMFPFVIDTSFLKVSESTYTDGRRTLDNPQIKLIVSPVHRAELYSEDIEYKVKNHIREKLIPLLRTMYEISPGFGLEIYFGNERSETILEHLIEK
jgi:hypothetical protein